ncbi:MAG: sugar phosphate isomerase/epimerase [Clostridia bacterium]|nr:sugar phosphate isomerase/epimerase [Clostridia bacterium]
MFKLGIITDEVSQDFEEALQFAQKNKLDCVELRSAWEKNPFQYDEEDFQRIAGLLKQYEMPLLCISSPLFKCDFYNPEERKEHLEGLKRLLAHKDLLGFTMIRCFDFYLKEGMPVSHEQIKEAFAEPIALCKAAGVTLVLECEPSTHSGNCETTAATIRAVGSETLRGVYEPGNVLFSGTDEVPFPQGYERMKDVFAHVHIKDAKEIDGKMQGVCVGTGLVDYPGIIQEFIDSGYEGALIFEPHYKPNGIVISEEVFRNPQGSAISAFGDIASQECIDSLRDIIAKVTK